MRPEGPRRRQEPPEGIATTANGEFKGGYGRWFAAGLIVTVLAHFTLFELFPQFRAANIGTTAEALETVELPPQVEIPPPTEQIPRPAFIPCDVASELKNAGGSWRPSASRTYSTMRTG